MKLKVGNVELKNNIILAPMAGITNLAYRKMLKSFGCGLVVSEMISDFALIYGTKVDKHGNATFYGTTRNINTVMATAAETVIIQADELVDELDPNEVVIPGLFIDYIVVKEGNK